VDRLLRQFVVLSLLPGAAAFAQSDTLSRQHFVAGVDFGYVHTSGLPSWTEGSVGKLRFDDDSDGLVVSRAFFDYETRLADTVDFNATVEFYDDDLGSAVDFTEAYVEWRPVPRSANRYRLKVGAFYPKVSLENTDPGWSSPYTISSSTINTWIAEEFRTFGAELSWSRRPQFLGGNHQFGIQAAVYWYNDPAGSLLAWKGWSAHDRQSRFGDELPLPPLPQIQPGMMFEAQDPFVAPFREVDGRAGYYVNGEWQIGRRLLLTAMHYDNRADPTQIEDGQYAWRTDFDHVGAKLSLPGGFGLIAQWMRGSTVMGPFMGEWHPVDVEYKSEYLLLTKTIDRHRLSVRYDEFDVTQNDALREDNNPEDGHVWTLAYRFAQSDNLSIAAEWLSIKTHHCGWVYYGIDPTATERQVQLSVQLRFAN
jgi:hypothetical protein